MLTVTQVNGLYYDNTSIRIGMPYGRLIVSHLKALNYKDTITPTQAHGTHGIPLPSGLGTYQASGSLTLVKEAWDDLLMKLPDGYGALVFPISVSYMVRMPGPSSNDVLKDCRIIDVQNGSSSGGNDGLSVELTLLVRYILRNGKCLYPIDIDQVPISPG